MFGGFSWLFEFWFGWILVCLITCLFLVGFSWCFFGFGLGVCFGFVLISYRLFDLSLGFYVCFGGLGLSRGVLWVCLMPFCACWF